MTADSDTNAAVTGFRLPEESGPHVRTFMQWPANLQVYGDVYFLTKIQDTIADIANTISEFEPVVMLMDNMHIGKARKKLGVGVEIWNIPTDDLWCRDSGPVFVKNGSGDMAVSQLNFNGWGNKQTHRNDGQIAERVASELGLKVLDRGLVGEGGGVECDGEGTLIAHESSWVNSNRNTANKDEIGQKLCHAFGMKKVVWAPGIIGQDVTDYHIDALARFTAPGKIIIQLPDRVYGGDIWSRAAFETHDILANSTDASGRMLEITTLPEPEYPRISSPDFVASYVNYYVCNDAVIAAQFGDPQADLKARTTLSDAFPGREVVMLNADLLGELGGGIHCATQQQPASV
ncbi:MAG: agmatine deiminase family protein [Rhizobiaceae bacterium]